MSSRTEDRLRYLLKSRGNLSSRDAGAALDITPQGAQQQLAKLAKAGLVEAIDERHGRGRPKRFWRLTEQGHARFPDRHSLLTLELLKSTEELFGPEGLEKLILHREAASLEAYRAALETCGSTEERVAELARIRTREGYMARCEKQRGGRFVLIEDHCPICAAAATCQSLCRSELRIFQAVLGSEVTIEMTDHVLAGARRCAYLIAPR